MPRPAFVSIESLESRTLLTADVAPYHFELFKPAGSSFTPVTTISIGQTIYPQIAFSNGGNSNLTTSCLDFAIFASPDPFLDGSDTNITDGIDTTAYDLAPGATAASFGEFSKFKVPLDLPTGDYYFLTL